MLSGRRLFVHYRLLTFGCLEKFGIERLDLRSLADGFVVEMADEDISYYATS